MAHPCTGCPGSSCSICRPTGPLTAPALTREGRMLRLSRALDLGNTLWVCKAPRGSVGLDRLGRGAVDGRPGHVQPA